jgi:beta-lactam-binding protein with PASTA domain
MPFRTRVWSLGKLFLLLGALAATFLLFAGIAMRSALRAREVDVPALVGRTVNEASVELASRDLSLRIESMPRNDEKVPAGRIVQQDPPASVQTRRQRSVRVWISAGPRAMTVPQLVGQTERTAQIRIDQEGLEIGTISEFRSPDYPADAVVSQDPQPSVKAPAVSLLLNRGEQATTYVMPDLIGMDGERAAQALRSKGFRVSIVGSQPYPGVPAGTVVRQQPAGGFQVAPADPISLEVSL